MCYSNDCPICLCEIGDKYVILQCGHRMHIDCNKQLFNLGRFHCPLCKKVAVSEKSQYILDYYQKLDEWRLQNYEYNGNKKISCIQCEKVSLVDYQTTCNRCSHCKSFNTYPLDSDKKIDS